MNNLHEYKMWRQELASKKKTPKRKRKIKLLDDVIASYGDEESAERRGERAYQ